MTATKHSNLIRLLPLEVGELPAHPDLPELETARPELKTFLVQLLDDGVNFLSPESIKANFKHHSTKQQSVSDVSVPVDVLTYTISSSTLGQIEWQSPNDDSRVSRSKPQSIPGEYWVARRSLHPNISSKDKTNPGHANWDEFVFGLRDQHSKHEQDFTPTLYHAHHVLDWNEDVGKLGDLGGRYNSVTLSVYEMCHKIPPPMGPRCFPVLVAVASTSPSSFIAVTVPVNLGQNVGKALYSSGRNAKDGEDEQSRKDVVLGVYTAVESVVFDESRNKDKPIEWFMATASDAKGNLPMWVQKSSMPGQVPKDVGFFLNWIRTVDESEVPKQPDPVKVA